MRKPRSRPCCAFRRYLSSRSSKFQTRRRSGKKRRDSVSDISSPRHLIRVPSALHVDKVQKAPDLSTSASAPT